MRWRPIFLALLTVLVLGAHAVHLPMALWANHEPGRQAATHTAHPLGLAAAGHAAGNAALMLGGMLEVTACAIEVVVPATRTTVMSVSLGPLVLAWTLFALGASGPRLAELLPRPLPPPRRRALLQVYLQ